MPAPISVVIPTLNATNGLGPTLASVFVGVEAGIVRDVILSDGGSDDGIAQVAQDTGAQLIVGPSGRGGQLRRGVDASQAPWVLVLHGDTELAPDWAQAAQVHMAENPDHAGYFQLQFDVGGFAPRIVAGWANLRSRLFGLPYGDQGILIPRSLYDAVDGYPDQPLMEDVALALKLRGKLRLIPAQAITSAAKYQAMGWLRRGWRNLTTLALFFLGRDPEALAKRYRSGW